MVYLRNVSGIYKPTKSYFVFAITIQTRTRNLPHRSYELEIIRSTVNVATPLSNCIPYRAREVPSHKQQAIGSTGYAVALFVQWTDHSSKRPRYNHVVAVPALAITEFNCNATADFIQNADENADPSVLSTSKAVENADSDIPIINNTVKYTDTALPFRGESGGVVVDANGLFLELFEFSVRKDEKLQQQIMKSVPTNAKYTSPDIQNEIIKIMCRAIVDKIMTQQLLFDILYVASQQKYVSLSLNLTHKNSQNITSEILLTQNSLHFNFDKLIAQSYDGASIMKGIHSGVQELIFKKLNRNKLFLHCFDHQLHLVVVHAVEAIPELKEYFDLCEQ
ncbi:hypothetical protein PR048_020867 [Dryococelus australis]|uniref:DUF4371 domain-containing protein n=1 Tax=Dryococelus australis TaxID=614101 RepID=A0ABQ9GWM0_9NEOP|nr:hypothetical protein PR048_020867 [Dryococelus australis]